MKYTIVDIAEGFGRFPRVVYMRKMDTMERKTSDTNRMIADHLKALIALEDLYDTHAVTDEKEYFRHRAKQEAGEFAGLYAPFLHNELTQEQNNMLDNMGYETLYTIDNGDIFDRPLHNCLLGESRDRQNIRVNSDDLDDFLKKQWWKKLNR